MCAYPHYYRHMSLRTAVERTIRASGMRPYVWAVEVAGLPKSTFRTLMLRNTASGATLAKLQAAGVNVSSRKLIASLLGAA
jgi:hypothetical protein